MLGVPRGFQGGDALCHLIQLLPNSAVFLLWNSPEAMEEAQVPLEETLRDEPEARLRGEPTGRAKQSVRLVASILLLCAAGLIAWQIIDGANPDGTTVSALLAGAIAVLALAYPKAFLSLGDRISNVDAFGIKLELQAKEAQLTIGQLTYEEDGADGTPPEWPSSNRKAMAKVSNLLRERLRFVAVALLDERSEIAEEYIVDLLPPNGLLTPPEAALCKELLGSDLQTRLGELDNEEREEFLDSAWSFASRFASRSFDRQARRALVKGGWKVADFTQDKGHRRDFIAVLPEIRALIATRVAAPRRSVATTGSRLADVSFPLPDLRRVVVVPDHVDHLWAEIDHRPMKAHERVLVVRIGQLIADPELACTDPADTTLVPEAAPAPAAPAPVEA